MFRRFFIDWCGLEYIRTGFPLDFEFLLLEAHEKWLNDLRR